MMYLPGLKKYIKENEIGIYSWFCIGIIYSFFFWTLLNSIFSILLALFWLFFSKKNWNISSFRTRLLLVFISIFIVALIGMIHTSNIDRGIFSLQKKSALLLFPVVFGTTNIPDQAFINRLIKHFILALVLSAMAGIIFGAVHSISAGNPDLLTGRDILPFPNQFPYIMGFAAILGISFIWSDTGYFSPPRIKWGLFCIFLLSAFILLLSNRLTIICWLIIILYFLFKTIRNPMIRMITALLVLVSVISSALLFHPLKNQWKEMLDFSKRGVIQLDEDSSLQKSWGGKAVRLALWQCGMDLIREHWIVGVGTGDIQDSLQVAYERRKFYFASRYNRYNLHNEYLQLLGANGIAGLMSLLLCIFVPLLLYRKKFDQNIYFIFLILFSVICITECILAVNKGILFYSFFNSLFAFGYLRKSNTFKKL